MALEFLTQLDAIDISGESLVLGLSNLEGDTWDGSIRIIGINSGDELNYAKTPAGITCVKFFNERCSDRTMKKGVLAGRDDGLISVYHHDLALAEHVNAHNDIVSSIALTSDGFVSSGWDEGICCWDQNNLDKPVLRLNHAHAGHVNSVDAVSTQIASVGMDGFLRIWDPRCASSSVPQAIFNLGMAGSCVHFARYSGDEGRYVYVGLDDGRILCRDLRRLSTEELDIDSSFNSSGNSNVCDSKTHTLRVRQLLTSASRPGLVLSCSDDTTVAVNEVTPIHDRMTELTRFDVHSDYVSGIAWWESHLGDGDLVYSTSWDRSLRQSVLDLRALTRPG